MADINFIDFYIGYPGHPRFTDKEMIEDDVIRVIVQKYEMVIFTNKGDLLGDPNFGADLPALLYETRLSAEAIEGDIRLIISFNINTKTFSRCNNILQTFRIRTTNNNNTLTP